MVLAFDYACFDYIHSGVTVLAEFAFLRKLAERRTHTEQKATCAHH